MILFLNFSSMILPPEYSWLEIYLDNDALWLEDNLNWDLAFDIALSDFTLFTALSTPFFANNKFFTDSIVKMSFIDVLFFFESDKSELSRSLYYFLIWDISTSFSTKYLPTQFLFYTNNQDYLTLLLHYSPELILIVGDFIDNYWVKAFLNVTPSVVFDLFSDSAISHISEFIEYLTLIMIFFFFILLVLNIFHLIKPNNAIDAYLTKFHSYFYSSSKETRIQFEAFLTTFFFFFFYWSMMIASFDDEKEEAIEIFDVSFFYFFCFIIFFLLFKYSQHYFAFLEASVAEGRSVSFITKQFFRDFINTFALLLRFFVLLFRLNVYDTLDDFYDSYYIFIGDFDDDEYFNEMFFSLYSSLFYDFDNNDDRSFSLEDEHDLFFDLFNIYFYYWGKFFTFIFFILEEILRISLAFYISYLIIFDVHAVNASYQEDETFKNQRSHETLTQAHTFNL